MIIIKATRNRIVPVFKVQCKPGDTLKAALARVGLRCNEDANCFMMRGGEWLEITPDTIALPEDTITITIAKTKTKNITKRSVWAVRDAITEFLRDAPPEAVAVNLDGQIVAIRAEFLDDLGMMPTTPIAVAGTHLSRYWGYDSLRLESDGDGVRIMPSAGDRPIRGWRFQAMSPDESPHAIAVNVKRARQLNRELSVGMEIIACLPPEGEWQ